MATLDEMVMKAWDKQMRSFMEERAHFVRVELLEPYAGDPDGIVTMRYGSTDATVINPNNVDADVTDLAIAPGLRPRVIPGRPIHYHLSFKKQMLPACVCEDYHEAGGNLELGPTTMMPLPAATLHFGRWTRFGSVVSPERSPDIEDTIPYNRKAVAAMWGGYKLRRRIDGNDSYKTLDKIGAPRVPNVKITRLDTQFRTIPNSTFIPWETYQFAKDVVADRWNTDGQGDSISVTAAQLDEMVAEMVKRQLAQASAGGK